MRDDELSTIHTIHRDFIGHATSSMNTGNSLVRGRPFGGLAILWRKTLSEHLTVEKYGDSRIMCCRIGTLEDHMLLTNVYLPYQCRDNYDEYIQCLGQLTAIIDQCTTSRIAVVGDFNAKCNTPFHSELTDFIHGRQMKLSDFEILGDHSDNYTYVSDAHGSTSWLDHYV